MPFCPIIGDDKLDHLIGVDHYKDAFPLQVQAYLSDMAGLVLDYSNKATISKQVK